MKNFTFQPYDGCSVQACVHTELENTAIPMRALPAILICPGGGYDYVSAREGEPVAQCYYAKGYHTFILDYSVKEHSRNFEPLTQLAAAIAYIRSHAQQWNVAPDKIAVCGFSAGGHLAASLGTLYDDEKFLAVCPDMGNIRPDAMVLGYPVITADEYTHEGTLNNVSGGANKTSEQYRYFGLDRHVDARTPQTFLWHTAADNSVPVENSLKFAAALSAAKVPFELHVLPEGEHGLSVCTNEVGTCHPYNSRWVDWSIRWLNRVFDTEA